MGIDPDELVVNVSAEDLKARIFVILYQIPTAEARITLLHNIPHLTIQEPSGLDRKQLIRVPDGMSNQEALNIFNQAKAEFEAAGNVIPPPSPQPAPAPTPTPSTREEYMLTIDLKNALRTPTAARATELLGKINNAFSKYTGWECARVTVRNQYLDILLIETGSVTLAVIAAVIIGIVAVTFITAAISWAVTKVSTNTKEQEVVDDTTTALAGLDQLYNDGLITKDEWQQNRDQLINLGTISVDDTGPNGGLFGDIGTGLGIGGAGALIAIALVLKD